MRLYELYLTEGKLGNALRTVGRIIWWLMKGGAKAALYLTSIVVNGLMRQAVSSGHVTPADGVMGYNKFMSNKVEPLLEKVKEEDGPAVYEKYQRVMQEHAEKSESLVKRLNAVQDVDPEVKEMAIKAIGMIDELTIKWSEELEKSGDIRAALGGQAEIIKTVDKLTTQIEARAAEIVKAKEKPERPAKPEATKPESEIKPEAAKPEAGAKEPVKPETKPEAAPAPRPVKPETAETRPETKPGKSGKPKISTIGKYAYKTVNDDGDVMITWMDKATGKRAHMTKSATEFQKWLEHQRAKEAMTSKS